VGEAVRLEILRNGQPLTLDAKVGEYVPAKAEGDDIDPRLAGAFFEDIGPQSPLSGKVQGVLVAKVESGSPAARAGLRPNDIITAINRQRVSSTDELQRISGGDALLINLIRGRGELLLVLR
jgi:serine protease Do/serine protease DegQ